MQQITCSNRQRFIIHGCIDGYSRKIVYLQRNTNNNTQTVLEAFIEAVNNHGLPSRVRGDQGVENVSVARFRLNHLERDPDRGSFISGISVQQPTYRATLGLMFTFVVYTHFTACSFFLKMRDTLILTMKFISPACIMCFLQELTVAQKNSFKDGIIILLKEQEI